MTDAAIVILFFILAGAFSIATILAKYYRIQYKLLKRKVEEERYEEILREIETVFGDIDYENLKGG